MVLASVFRLFVLIAGFFSGESARRTMPSIAAIAVRLGHFALADSPGNRITKNRFNEGRSLFTKDQRIAPVCVAAQRNIAGGRLWGLWRG